MKQCHKCKVFKSLSDFNKNLSRGDGLQARCKTCDQELARRNYHRKYKEKHKERAYQRKKDIRQWLVDYKKSQLCDKCGDNRWYVLDFHHNNDKDDSVANLVARGCSVKKITAEIAKCTVLCSNCHREEHYLAWEANLVKA